MYIFNGDLRCMPTYMDGLNISSVKIVNTHPDNPVKHGLVNHVRDWPWSSFYCWVHAGIYPADWGGGSISATSEVMEYSTGES